MMQYTESMCQLLEEFQKLPGIGSKSAERLVFHILKISDQEAFQLADAIRAVKQKTHSCHTCFHLSETDPCAICADPTRDHTTICVVEQPKDLIAIEKTGSYHGLYHVLMGHLAPLDNQNPEDLTIVELVQRIKTSSQGRATAIQEVILATNPNVEGDTTALYITQQLQGIPVKVTRIARGIPTGSSIEFANQAILSDALAGRTQLP